MSIADDHVESLVEASCFCCGAPMTADPSWTAAVCMLCVLLDIRTPEEFALTQRIPLVAWDAYRLGRAVALAEREKR